MPIHVFFVKSNVYRDFVFFDSLAKAKTSFFNGIRFARGGKAVWNADVLLRLGSSSPFSTINELDQRLDPLDQRWKAFGWNRPGAQETPDQVEHVQATLLGPTAAALKWNGTARAEYRVFKKVLGVDTDYVSVGSPADLDFTIEGLPTGATIEIVVSAVNNGGEGQQSETITLITHS